MRIAYIAPYQGPGLIDRRPILRNLALAANVKIELISELLRRGGHEIELLSQGEVVEHSARFFPAFLEPKPFSPDIPVSYASAIPVKYVNGAWAARRTLSLFRRRHRIAPFDVALIYNLKQPQVACASYALRRLHLPVVLEYEDDALVDLGGRVRHGLRSGLYAKSARRIMDSAVACVGVSPHLLSQTPAAIPKMLLRGVVDEDIITASQERVEARKNWVVYSGTHFHGKGLEPLIEAWKMVDQRGWELHVAGRGELTARLEEQARGVEGIVFHGLLDRRENARFLGQAKIGINPHDVSRTPGNVFAFKIIEYLAAGAHCVTTPMGALESDVEAGITYMPDNAPTTIARTLTRVIAEREYERLATHAAQARYGPDAVARSLDGLLNEVAALKSA